MKVYKFGGASVKDAAGVRNLAQIARNTEGRLFVVVSAMGKTTNALERVMEAFWQGHTGEAVVAMQTIVDYHAEILADLWGAPHLPERVRTFYEELEEIITLANPKSRTYEEWYDRIVSFGELISTTIVADYLSFDGTSAEWLDIRRIFLTNSRFRDANIDIEASTPRLLRAVDSSSAKVIVGQGFIGATESGATTTIGREGSDYSAAVAGYILGAESVSIWKDVEGILNGDPKQFEGVSYIPELTYLDAIELAYSGAQIIHPKTIKPLQNKNIPLYVRPFGDKTKPGTVINGEAERVKLPIMIYKRDQVFLIIRSRDFSFVMEEQFGVIFSLLDSYRIKTHLIHNSAVDLGLCVDSSWHIEELIKALEEEGFDVEKHDNVGLLTIRNYTDELYARYIKGGKHIVRQVNPESVRVVIRDEDFR